MLLAVNFKQKVTQKEYNLLIPLRTAHNLFSDFHLIKLICLGASIFYIILIKLPKQKANNWSFHFLNDI